MPPLLREESALSLEFVYEEKKKKREKEKKKRNWANLYVKLIISPKLFYETVYVCVIMM